MSILSTRRPWRTSFGALAACAIFIGASCAGDAREADLQMVEAKATPEEPAPETTPSVARPGATKAQPAAPGTKPGAQEERQRRATELEERREQSVNEAETQAVEEMRRSTHEATREQRAHVARERQHKTSRGGDPDGFDRAMRERAFQLDVADGHEKRTLEEARKDWEMEDTMIQLLLEDQGKEQAGSLAGGAVRRR